MTEKETIQCDTTERLATAKGYFGQKQALFDALAVSAQKCDSIERFRSSSTLMTILAIVGLVVYCWKAFLPFSHWFFEESPAIEGFFDMLSEQIHVGLVVVLWLIAMLVCYVLIYIAALLVVGILLMQIKTLCTAATHKRHSALVDQHIEALAEHYSHYKDALKDDCPVPFERCHPALIEQLQAIVLAGRADTVKEAINILL